MWWWVFFLIMKPDAGCHQRVLTLDPSTPISEKPPSDTSLPCTWVCLQPLYLDRGRRKSMEAMTFDSLEADKKLSCPRDIPSHPGTLSGPTKPAPTPLFCQAPLVLFNLSHLELSPRPVTLSDWVPTHPCSKRKPISPLTRTVPTSLRSGKPFPTRRLCL